MSMYTSTLCLSILALRLCLLTFPSSFPFLYLIPVSGSVMIVSSAGYLHHPSWLEFVRRSLLWWLRFLYLSAGVGLAPQLLPVPAFVVRCQALRSGLRRSLDDLLSQLFFSCPSLTSVFLEFLPGSSSSWDVAVLRTWKLRARSTLARHASLSRVRPVFRLDIKYPPSGSLESPSNLQHMNILRGIE